MFSHDDIWRGIDRLASSLGYSPSGLAKKAGLDPTSFNKSKRVSPDGKPRWPSTESVSKILAVTDCTMSDLIELMEEQPSGRVAVRLREGEIVTGTLLKQTKKEIILQLSGSKKQTIARTKLDWIARMVWTR